MVTRDPRLSNGFGTRDGVPVNYDANGNLIAGAAPTAIQAPGGAVVTPSGLMPGNTAPGGSFAPNAANVVPPPASPAGSPVNPGFTGSGGFPNALELNPNSYGAAFNDPGMVTAAYNMNNGIDPNSGSYALNSRYGKNLDVVYGLLNGGNILGSSPEDYFNFANNYIQQGATPGGTHISTQDVMSALFANDPQSPIYQMVYGLDQNGNAPTPDTIVNRFIGVMQQGMANEAPPMVINALTSMYAQAGDEWKVLVAQGKFNGSFTDYLQQKGLGPQLVGG